MSVDSPNILQTIAEISIAFAGFSGLIVALRKRPGPLTRVQKFRLQVLLALAFGALFLSFMPDAIWTLSGDERGPEYLPNIVLLGYSLIFVGWWTASSRTAARAAPEIFNWFAFARMTAGHAVVIGLQSWVLLAGRIDYASGVFLVGLIWYLLHAAQQFCRMLFVQVAED